MHFHKPTLFIFLLAYITSKIKFPVSRSIISTSFSVIGCKFNHYYTVDFPMVGDAFTSISQTLNVSSISKSNPNISKVFLLLSIVFAALLMVFTTIRSIYGFIFSANVFSPLKFFTKAH